MLKIPEPGHSLRLKLLAASMFSKLQRNIFLKTYQQLVICGFPRGGTSLLYNMFSSCLPGFQYQEFEDYFIYKIHRLNNVATKAPLDVLHLSDMDRLNIHKKKLIVIIMVRDIRDVITSRHPIYPGEYFIGYDHSWWPQTAAHPGAPLNELAWKYDAPGVMEIYHAIRAHMGEPHVTVIKYEDLVADADRIQSALASKYALSFSGKFSEYHASEHRHAYKYEGKHRAADESLVMEGKSVTSDRVSRWASSEQHRARVLSQFEACPELFDVLEYYGYETSRDWFYSLSERGSKAV
jgi:hypothetical protein